MAGFCPYRILRYTGPSSVYCTSDSTFLLASNGVEDPKCEFIVLFKTGRRGWVEFEYRDGWYIGELVGPLPRFDTSPGFNSQLDVYLLRDISSL